MTVVLSGDAKQRALSVKISSEGRTPFSATVEWAGGIWEPAPYAALARDFARAYGLDLKNEAGAVDADFLTLYDEERDTAFYAAARRLSQTLSASPLAAKAHAQAAQFLGISGLSEKAGKFTDRRWAMNRMTAHLALAEAIEDGAPPARDRRLAGVLSLWLQGRERDTLAAFAAWRTATGADAARDALEKTATIWLCDDWVAGLGFPEDTQKGDDADIPRDENGVRCYGSVPDAMTRVLQHAPIAEWGRLRRLALVRALCARLGSVRGETLAARLGAAPDWGRVLLCESFTVGQGHRWAERQIKCELEAAGRCVAALGGVAHSPEAARDALFRFLKQEGDAFAVDGDFSKMEIYPEAAAGAFYRRHLMNALDRFHFFLKDRWNVPEKAQQLRDAVFGGVFGSLPLACFLRQDWCVSQADYNAAMRECADFIGGDPLRVPCGAALFIHYQRDGLAFHVVANCRDFYTPAMPEGTAFELDARMRNNPYFFYSDADLYGQWRSVAPSNAALMRRHFSQIKAKGGSYAELLDRLRDIGGRFCNQDGLFWNAHFDILKNAASQDAFLAESEKIVRISPSCYFDVGQYFAEKRDYPRAAAFYEKGFRHFNGLVELANSGRWLVDYNLSLGKREDAFEIARFCEEVYSQRGLETRIAYDVAVGDWEHAEAIAQQIRQRYDDSSAMVGVAYLKSRAEPSIENHTRLRALSKPFFPDGLAPLNLENLAEKPPQRGVRLTKVQGVARAWGLERGDIIVGIAGVPVANKDAYWMALDFVAKFNEPVRVDYWSVRKNRICSAEGLLPERRLGCRIETLP